MIESLPEFESSNVEAASYNKTKNTLSVTFKTGGKYVYSHVGSKTWEGMKSASSVGKFLNEHVIPKHKGMKI